MYKILVVDDDEANLKMIRMMLTKAGYIVETAANGEEGAVAFSKSDFDMVITDFQMPNMDGNGIAAHIRGSNKRHTPIIGISGEPHRFNEINFDTILHKPVSFEELIETVSFYFPLNSGAKIEQCDFYAKTYLLPLAPY